MAKIIGMTKYYISNRYLDCYLDKSIYKKDNELEKLNTKSYKKYEKSFFRGKNK